MQRLKLTVIGGGSSYSPELIKGLMELHAAHPLREIVLLDIAAGKARQDIVQSLAERMLSAKGLNVTVVSTTDPHLALAGADFVVMQFRVGGMAARAKDEHIALLHGVVGQETTGPAGFAKALRTIPVALDYAKLAKELCPEAWLINFTNPSGIITEALQSQGIKRVIGLCNVPLTLQQAVAQGLQVSAGQIRLQMTGLNHLSLVTGIEIGGKDCLAEVVSHPATEQWLLAELPGPKPDRPWVSELGVVPSPYLLYYFFHKQMLAGQRADMASGKGTRADQVARIEDELLKRYQDVELQDTPAELGKRGGAWYSHAAVQLIRALMSETPSELVLNVKNMRAQTWLPENAVLETNCLVSKIGPQPISVPAPPVVLQGLVQHVKAYEQATIQAALSEMASDMVLALSMHPLVGDWQLASALVDDYLRAHGDLIRVRRS